MHKTQENLQKVAKLVAEARRITFFSGAGISVPSGIPDFRSPGGIWETYDMFEVATLRAFKKRPEKVWTFIRDLYTLFTERKPNTAHYAITDIQKLKGEDNVFIVTQNIDGLHQLAGSKNVHEVHGTPDILHCIRCGFEEQIDIEKHTKIKPYPICSKCKKPLKPKIVFFEELLDPIILSTSMKLARKSDLVIGVGTSLGVFPAADILLAPSPNKTKKALFNLTPTAYDRLLHYIILGDVIDTLPVLVKEVEKILFSEENKDLKRK